MQLGSWLCSQCVFKAPTNYSIIRPLPITGRLTKFYFVCGAGPGWPLIYHASKVQKLLRVTNNY